MLNFLAGFLGFLVLIPGRVLSSLPNEAAWTAVFSPPGWTTQTVQLALDSRTPFNHTMIPENDSTESAQLLPLLTLLSLFEACAILGVCLVTTAALTGQGPATLEIASNGPHWFVVFESTGSMSQPFWFIAGLTFHVILLPRLSVQSDALFRPSVASSVSLAASVQV